MANIERATHLLIRLTEMERVREIRLRSFADHLNKVEAAEERVSRVVSYTRLKKAKKALKQRRKKMHKASRTYAQAAVQIDRVATELGAFPATRVTTMNQLRILRVHGYEGMGVLRSNLVNLNQIVAAFITHGMPFQIQQV